MRSNLGRTLEQKVNQMIAEKSAVILTGSFSELAPYKYECGVIEGLRVALSILDEIEQERDK